MQTQIEELRGRLCSGLLACLPYRCDVHTMSPLPHRKCPLSDKQTSIQTVSDSGHCPLPRSPQDSLQSGAGRWRSRLIVKLSLQGDFVYPPIHLFSHPSDHESREKDLVLPKVQSMMRLFVRLSGPSLVTRNKGRKFSPALLRIYLSVHLVPHVQWLNINILPGRDQAASTRAPSCVANIETQFLPSPKIRL